MILNLFRRTRRDDRIAALYGAIVAQAREPAFYRQFGVPDTANGRLEMIVLHTILVLFRLEADGVSGRQVGQALFDHFCSDMDANLREMAVGDLAVPRKMKAIAEAFYGRKRAYAAAMADDSAEPLATALGRNIYGGGASDRAAAEGLVAEGLAAEGLARYVREAGRRLAALDDSALLTGQVEFPDPLAFAASDRAGAVPVGAP
jgi:cytochrome b pre-mRNA-processing protein 3